MKGLFGVLDIHQTKKITSSNESEKLGLVPKGDLIERKRKEIFSKNSKQDSLCLFLLFEPHVQKKKKNKNK